MTPEEEEQLLKNDPYSKCLEKTFRNFPQGAGSLAFMARQHQGLVGDWIYNFSRQGGPEPQENSTEGKFLLALAKAGLLRTSRVTSDSSGALVLLEEVANEDPQNSAPLVFAAMIADKQGDRVAVQKLLKGLPATSRFDTYVSKITRRVWDQVRTGEDFFTAELMGPKSAQIDTLALEEFLVKRKLNVIAEQLIAELKQNPQGVADVDFPRYWIGGVTGILKSMGYKAEFLKARDKFESSLDGSSFGRKASDEFKKVCDVRVYDPMVAKLREHLEHREKSQQ